MAQTVKNLPAMQETQVQTLGQKDPLQTPVFLPGKSHGQRNLAGYSLQGCKESDMTEKLKNNNKASIVFSLKPALSDEFKKSH